MPSKLPCSSTNILASCSKAPMTKSTQRLAASARWQASSIAEKRRDDMSEVYALNILHRPKAWPSPDPLVAVAVFPAEYTGFDGHFPGRPILPGFVQIQLAIDI